jgi:hypothetical protein
MKVFVFIMLLFAFISAAHGNGCESEYSDVTKEQIIEKATQEDQEIYKDRPTQEGANILLKRLQEEQKKMKR